MNQKRNLTIFFICILLYSAAFSSCAESILAIPSLVPTFSQTPLPIRTTVPSLTAAITATPIMNKNTITISPDDLFALPGLERWSTPDSGDFCEHLPPSQIVANPDGLSILSGRFTLCIWEYTRTALDLDTGSLVSTDDERGDIVMSSVPWGSDEYPVYGIDGWNTAYLEHAHPNYLSYAYCENLLQGNSDGGATVVEEGEIACVKTTKGKIALIRVEKIYPANTLSAEFSFAVLRNE